MMELLAPPLIDCANHNGRLPLQPAVPGVRVMRFVAVGFAQGTFSLWMACHHCAKCRQKG